MSHILMSQQIEPAIELVDLFFSGTQSVLIGESHLSFPPAFISIASRYLLA